MQYGAVGHPQAEAMEAAWPSGGPPAGHGYPPPPGPVGYPDPGSYWPQSGQIPTAFGSRFSQHTNTDGLWQFESNNRPNKYFF